MVRSGFLVAGLGLMAAAAPWSVAAQDAALPTVVLLEATADGGPEGVAVLTPSGSDTVAQVQVVAPPAGTSAAIHGGSCDAIDPTPVALLGTVGGPDLVVATVPVALSTLTDGAHVVVLHPGIDLATALACGVIPAAGPGPVASPTAAPASAAPTAYAAPHLPYAISWSAPWAPTRFTLTYPDDGIALSDGTSAVAFEAFEQPSGDALACRDAWQSGLLAALRGKGLQDLEPVLDASGAAIWEGDAQHARGGYAWASTKAPDTAWAEVIDCRRLTDSAVLRITHLVPLAGYLEAVPAVEALLEGLAVGPASVGATGVSGQASSPAPSPSVASPSPVAAAGSPAASPDCTGFQPWVDAAAARNLRLQEIAKHVQDKADDQAAYVAALRDAVKQIGVLRAEQAADAAPRPLAGVHQQLDALYGTYIDAYTLLADGVEGQDQSLLTRAQAKAKDADALAARIDADAGVLLTACGIRAGA